MKFSILNRKVHYWLSLAVVIPFTITVITGILLIYKKQIEWVQPTEHKGTPNAVNISLDSVLSIVRSDPNAGITSWADVSRVDIRPEKGLMKVISLTNWEIQLHTDNGSVQHSAYRRSDVIEALHDGSFFSDVVKYYVNAPAAFFLMVMLITGVVLFIIPLNAKRKKKRKMNTQPTIS